MKKFNIIIVILLVISLWMNYNNKKEIEMLSDDIRSNYHMIQNGSTVRNILEDFKKESMWVQSSHYEIIKFSDDLKNADLKISISLKEKNNNEKLYVTALSKDSDYKQKFVVPKTDDLNYMLNITLPTENDYELQLIGENAEYTRSSMLNKVYLSRYIGSLVNIDAGLLGAEYSNNTNEGYFKFFVAVNKLHESKELYTHFVKDLEITEVKADVYYGEEYIDTIDLINEINYTPVDINKLSNSIPESASGNYTKHHEIVSSIGEYKQQYFFSGKHEIKDVPNMLDIIMVIKVKDNLGNIYQKIIGDYHKYDYWVNKIKD